MGKGPLQGIKVVDFSNYVAAPSCARLLAEFGADVIKIETFSGDPWRITARNMIRKTGDDENPIYEVYNIGKKDICLDIKNEKGFQCLMKMIEGADIFLTNTRPASLKKRGLDAQTLTEKFPRLIYASLNGFGTKGPEADKPGFDSVAFWARSGFLKDMSYRDNPYPVFGPTGVGDGVAGGALLSGILAALYQRERTGKGDIVETSLYGSAIWFMGSMVTCAQPKYNITYPKSRLEATPFSAPYRCADGKWIFIVILEYTRYGNKAFEILGLTEKIAQLGVTDDISLRKNSATVIPMMEEAFSKKNFEEWIELFRAADIVSDQVAGFRDIAESQQAWENEFIENYKLRNGEECILPCPPIKMASYEREPSTLAPLPGEHTDEVLRLLGYSENEITEFHNCGAVK